MVEFQGPPVRLQKFHVNPISLTMSTQIEVGVVDCDRGESDAICDRLGLKCENHKGIASEYRLTLGPLTWRPRIISVAASRDRLVGGYASLFDSHLTFRLLPKKGDKGLNNKMPIRNLFLVRSKEDQTRSLGSQVPAECGLAETIFIANRTLILGFRDSAIWQRHFGSGVTRLTSRKDKGCTRVEHFGVVIFLGWSILLQPPSTIRNPLSTPSHPTPKGRRTRVHD
uniref:HDC17109 n=1 Tax=Drosophila melanogaster TaxID=7227 RepID=Q6IIU0_DROME|nr:TPA_inf: HDC17109 [Drosophila melanogaster]